MIDAEIVNNEKEKVFDELREETTLHAEEDKVVEIDGYRYNIMGADYFMADIYGMLTEKYAEETGTILQTAGVKYGRRLASSFEDRNGAEQFGAFLGLLSLIGYSKPEVDESEIVFSSSPTAEEYRKKENDQQETCYFLKGMLIGASMETSNLSRFEETKCIANGDEKCVFEVSEE